MSLRIYMPAGSSIRGTISRYENGTLKVARNVFNIGGGGGSRTDYFAMVTKLLSTYCGAP